MTGDPTQVEASATGNTSVPPTPGEVITSLATGTTYTMGEMIGEGFFGVVYACFDGWGNDLAAKVLKPTRTHDELAASALAELQKLVTCDTLTSHTSMTPSSLEIRFTS